MTAPTQRVELRLLTGEPAEMATLQHLLEGAPAYAYRITGLPPGPSEAQSLYTVLPPNKEYKDKFVLAAHAADLPGSPMVGVVDVIRGYPSSEKAFLGLLLLSESWQGQGYGRATYVAVEDFVKAWSEIHTIRLAVVASNSVVDPFWARMGFEFTGEEKPHSYGSFESTTRLMEKKLR